MPTGKGQRVTIRPARAADAARCAEIFLHGRRHAFSWQPADRFGLDDYYDCVREDAVLVAELDGAVTGFISLDPQAGVIHNLFIDPRWHKRGIGSALLREALLLLRGGPQPAELACAARNAAARAFYERNGWTPVGLAPDHAEALVLYRLSSAG
ncbi:GNAT family N-acetyltransferase [Azospirillum picis]|uniref:Ribosomal protein S18 acetylase RimI-like enzyme n=1 Tax=Azospirillum picis TaxID=488438 RepID=A0ABU0MQ36_9PROT|nr:GNAT family N-acetyltransferase [Azospirillum picis]MBP2301461.1 ribosomal protein S18 acetylase RimI-like enzyme [Azospirillum picis]MDQ0535293.1 ribosomal protein S18 acetylase RimI-like enzyme [Azospirillum picis]